MRDVHQEMDGQMEGSAKKAAAADSCLPDHFKSGQLRVDSNRNGKNKVRPQISSKTRVEGTRIRDPICRKEAKRCLFRCSVIDTRVIRPPKAGLTLDSVGRQLMNFLRMTCLLCDANDRRKKKFSVLLSSSLKSVSEEIGSWSPECRSLRVDAIRSDPSARPAMIYASSFSVDVLFAGCK